MVTSETDEEFLQQVGEKAETLDSPTTLQPIHADIGPTADWGRPADASKFPHWPRAAARPWEWLQKNKLQPDFILIDGRFRIHSWTPLKTL